MSRHIAAIGAAIASTRHSSPRRQRVGQVKGVSGPVGLNLADPSFISQGKETKLALGLGALLLVGAALYYAADKEASE